MEKPRHLWTKKVLDVSFLSFSFSEYLFTYQPIFYLFFYLLISFIISYCEEEEGWVRCNFFFSPPRRTHRKRHCPFIINYCWGGVGYAAAGWQSCSAGRSTALTWANAGWVCCCGMAKGRFNRVYTQALQEALVLYHQSLRGKRGIGCGQMRWMFLYKYRCRNRNYSDMIISCWDGLGWNGTIEKLYFNFFQSHGKLVIFLAVLLLQALLLKKIIQY